LGRCVHSLLKQNYPHLEIIIVANGEDASSDNIRKEFPAIKIISNRENRFFSQAQNQGIKESKGEFLLCLNDDVVLERRFIDESIKAMNIDEQIGMVSGKILRMDKITIDSTGLFLGRSRRPIERGFNRKDNGQYDKAGYIFGVSGAAAFYRRAMLGDICDINGYFDKRYEIFYEDLDLAWRARRKGWRGYYTPEAVTYHRRGATVKTVAPNFKFLKRFNFVCLNEKLKVMLVKNRYMTMLKNDSFLGIIFNLPFILAYEIKLYLYIILFCPKLLIPIFKGWPDKTGFERQLSTRTEIPPEGRN
jgi:GT2 family glycosyltransferase